MNTWTRLNRNFTNWNFMADQLEVGKRIPGSSLVFEALEERDVLQTLLRIKHKGELSEEDAKDATRVLTMFILYDSDRQLRSRERTLGDFFGRIQTAAAASGQHVMLMLGRGGDTRKLSELRDEALADLRRYFPEAPPPAQPAVYGLGKWPSSFSEWAERTSRTIAEVRETQRQAARKKQ